MDMLRALTYLPIDGHEEVGDMPVTGNGSQLLDLWLRSMRARNFSPQTVTSYRRTVTMFLIWAADNSVGLDTATHGDIGDWLDSRQLGPRSRYAYTSALATFYGWALREEHLDRDPTIRVDRPRLGRYLPRPADLELVLQALDEAEPREGLMIALGAFAGCRRAEIAGVRVEDFLLGADPPMVLLHGKGNKERLVPLHDVVLSALRRYTLPRTGWLFPSPTGRGMTPSYVGKIMTEACFGIAPHMLRHLFGTNSYGVCQDLRVVQELLGHASPSTTAIYTAFSPLVAAQTVAGLPARTLRAVPDEAA